MRTRVSSTIGARNEQVKYFWHYRFKYLWYLRYYTFEILYIYVYLLLKIIPFRPDFGIFRNLCLSITKYRDIRIFGIFEILYIWWFLRSSLYVEDVQWKFSLFPIMSWFSTDRHMGCVLSRVSLRRWIRIAEESAFVLNALGAGKYTGRLFLHCTYIARICTYAVMLTWIRGIHPDRIELLGTQLHFNISVSI